MISFAEAEAEAEERGIAKGRMRERFDISAWLRAEAEVAGPWKEALVYAAEAIDDGSYRP